MDDTYFEGLPKVVPFLCVFGDLENYGAVILANQHL
jgi:hypothetical protein